MTSELFLHFRKADYKSRTTFVFPYGMTIYDATSDMIYRCQEMSFSPRPMMDPDLFFPPIPITVNKFLFFAYPGSQEVLSPQILGIIRAKAGYNGYADVQLTEAEWKNAAKAVIRYKKAPKESLSWPVSGAVQEIDPYITAFVATKQERALLHRAGGYAYQEPPPEKLFTPEEVAARRAAAKAINKKYIRGQAIDPNDLDEATKALLGLTPARPSSFDRPTRIIDNFSDAPSQGLGPLWFINGSTRLEP